VSQGVHRILKESTFIQLQCKIGLVKYLGDVIHIAYVFLLCLGEYYDVFTIHEAELLLNYNQENV